MIKDLTISSKTNPVTEILLLLLLELWDWWFAFGGLDLRVYGMKKLPEFVCRPGVGVAAKLGRIETLDRECQEYVVPDRE